MAEPSLAVFRPHHHQWVRTERRTPNTGAPVYGCRGCDAEAMDTAVPESVDLGPTVGD